MSRTASAWRSLAACCLLGAVFAQPALAQGTPANAPSPAVGQPPVTQPIAPQARQESFDGVTPYEAFGYRLTINAAAPVSYLGSAYRDDISGQSESNSGPALDESIRGGSPNRIDAW